VDGEISGHDRPTAESAPRFRVSVDLSNFVYTVGGCSYSRPEDLLGIPESKLALGCAEDVPLRLIVGSLAVNVE